MDQDAGGLHPVYLARLQLLDGIPAPGMSNMLEVFEQRAAFEAPFGPPELPDVATDDFEAPGPNGPVRARSYRRTDLSRAVPALVWLHGGAFMYGDLDMPEADHFARQIAHRAGAVVVSVDYRRCDEQVRQPVPHDDCYAVYTWVRQNALQLGIDPGRIAVGGASAGGNLAASVALHAGEAGQRPWQLLLAYPALHPVVPPPSAELASALATIPEALRFKDDGGALNEFVIGRRLSAATPYDFPALASDFSTFPPTYIENCEFDGLRASGEAFADALAAAGVDVEAVTARGLLHGHLNSIGAPFLDPSWDRFASRLRPRPVLRADVGRT